ncbi:MAG: glycosyltransferase [Lachnospiraceae bacterium]|nr:glycosyltransferase [Lachnospiraceae bacterium]
MDLISVVMSVYNEKEEWVRKSIESILRQTYVNIEFIIILDNPVNTTLAKVIETYQMEDNRVKFLVNTKNEGLVYSLNYGISEAKGKYIARMDADDYSSPERLVKEYQCMIDNQVDFIMTGVNFLYEERYQEGTKYGELDSIKFAELMKYGNVSVHPTWLFDKEIYYVLKGYRNISYCEDLDFVLRALQHGYKCYRMKEHLLDYRFRNSGISKSNALEQHLRATALQKLYIKGEDIGSINVDYFINMEKECSKRNKEIFSEADKMMGELVEYINEKRIFACGINILIGLVSNKYYRLLFCKNVRFRLKLAAYTRKQI